MNIIEIKMSLVQSHAHAQTHTGRTHARTLICIHNLRHYLKINK